MKLGRPKIELGGPNVTRGDPNVASQRPRAALETPSVTPRAHVGALPEGGIRGCGDKKRGRALGTPP